MLVTVTRTCPEPEPPVVIDAIYKPTIGERPLDDFPDGTLARREVAAWHVSEASGWGIVPPTILRDGPFGEGMVQAFIEADPDVDVVAMVVEDDPRLRRMAVLDAVMNNTDRKGGHILPVDGGRHVHGVDHGVCFSPMPEAPDGAVGLAREAARRRTRSRGSSGSATRSTAISAPACATCCRGPRSARRCAGPTRCSRRGGSPIRPRTGRRSPGRRSDADLGSNGRRRPSPRTCDRRRFHGHPVRTRLRLSVTRKEPE